jgi:hypothetical protein
MLSTAELYAFYDMNGHMPERTARDDDHDVQREFRIRVFGDPP